MNKKILIIKNITREGPGLLEDILTNKGIDYTLVDLDAGEVFPSPLGYDALIVLGGPDSANDENDKIRTEIHQIQKALAAKIPYLGICLGLQTLVKSAGGKVIKNQIKEIGFRDPNGDYFSVELTEEGKTDGLFTGLENTFFNVFQLHGETVTLTENMVLLASGRSCTNQIIRVGENAYGIQCHFELTQEMFDIWMEMDADLQTVDKDLVRADFLKTREVYVKVGNTLFENFLKKAGF